MKWTNLHARLLSEAFEKILGNPPPYSSGSVAYARFLSPEVVRAAAEHPEFSPRGWSVWQVTDCNDESLRSITADRAVEMRESKSENVLFLVDTSLAGAGMDSIYSAAREVGESEFFEVANKQAARGITKNFPKRWRYFADRAIAKAKRLAGAHGLSPWSQFDFLVRTVAEKVHPGELIYILGLWPIAVEGKPDDTQIEAWLETSRRFVERLLGHTVSSLTPMQRIDSLRLYNPTKEQIQSLEIFIRSAASKPLSEALEELATKRNLWVNSLKVESAVSTIHEIELIPWRTKTGQLSRWSGLVQEGGEGEPPVFIIDPDADETGNYSKLEVRWRARPENLEKGAVEYNIAIISDMDEEIASQTVQHTGRTREKCRFTNDDFSSLSEDVLISARIVISIIGNDAISPQETEEFFIRFGQPPERAPGGVGKKVRAFSEGLIELEDRDIVSAVVSSVGQLPVDSKGNLILRTPIRGKSYRIFHPPLLHEIEQNWVAQSNPIGRWKIRVRTTGARAGKAEFEPLEPPRDSMNERLAAAWERTISATKRIAARFAMSTSVGQVYDEKAKHFDNVVKEYLLAWSALLDEASGSGYDVKLALANTVEVQTLSGRTIGLIVLPSHPLRVAWQTAYDNLVLHLRFEENARPQDIRNELAVLDGALIPPFLPGIQHGTTFVFADVLGFHCVGMVLDSDKEPKASIAILGRALGEAETLDTAPIAGKQSARVLGEEITKYIECHDTSSLILVHALRPGDGLTLARALSQVYQNRRSPSDETSQQAQLKEPAFVVELYPSKRQWDIAGRFIAETCEKRRRGAGVVAPEDRWMLESIGLPGEVYVPRLRWARKTEATPTNHAHLAVAFDTFESHVAAEDSNLAKKTRPLFAYGLLSFFERYYSHDPIPTWRSMISLAAQGTKHPSDRSHTDRLMKLQQAILRCVARSLGSESLLPVLRTEISPEKAEDLRVLHRLCDWVITLDRNAGIEYFDSPRVNKEVYDAYVIDCVPEREDLGFLQLITSTSNLDEIRNLVDETLDRMGLSRSRRNAEFLLDNLRALSGRLAIRLTGQKAPTSELIALALSYASCLNWEEDADCWTPLQNGFLVPVDDIKDLLPPPLKTGVSGEGEIGATRPDLIYVSPMPRKGLQLTFIEIKYRRHLRGARSPSLLDAVTRQVRGFRQRWYQWYSDQPVPASFIAIRRAKLARVLRFYADKAHRHYLDDSKYEEIINEINRMVERGSNYSFCEAEGVDRGWIFCPEYAGAKPLEITPDDSSVRIFLFGPKLLPDSGRQINPSFSDGTTTLEPSDSPERQVVTYETPGLEAQSTRRDETVIDARRVADSARLHIGTEVFSGNEVVWTLSVKGNPHMLVVGLPGMGKTTCLLNLCKELITNEVRPIVFSYHQDIDERLQKLVGEVRLIDPLGLGFNPLKVIDRTCPKAYLDVAGAVRDIFVSIFPDLGHIQGELIRRAIKDSFIEYGWDDPDRDPSDLEEPPFGRFVEILRAARKPDRSLRMLLTRIDELADYGLFDTHGHHPSLWDSELPIVIRIHTTQNENLQKAFASIVFYGLYKDMFRRGIQERISHAIIFDEAHRAARLELIPRMAKECRKYGISLILASQEAKDFHTSLFSAIANYLILRVNETDARVLVRNVASSDLERQLIDRIKQIEKYRALYFSEGMRRPLTVALRNVG